MSKRTFASRTFAPRHFNSATWTGEGVVIVSPAFESSRHILYGTALSRHTLTGTALSRQALIGTSLSRHELNGATPR